MKEKKFVVKFKFRGHETVHTNGIGFTKEQAEAWVKRILEKYPEIEDAKIVESKAYSM